MLHITKKGDALFTTIDDEDVEVREVYARPLRSPDSEIAIVGRKSKQEYAWYPSHEDIPSPIRPLVEDALSQNYPIATITAFTEAEVRNGQRLVTVETDRGSRTFNLKEPGKNLTTIGSDGLLIRDAMGNRYRLPSMAALSEESQAILDQVT